MKIKGRQKQIELFDGLYDGKRPVFMAIYGRRRIGKTFLVTEYFKNKDCLFFHITGVKKARTGVQLQNFKNAMEEAFNKSEKQKIDNWTTAFYALALKLKNTKTKKKVLFFDEVPWLNGNKVDFLSAFDHFWNHYLSADPNIICIICGSSASWLIRKIIKGKFGFHHRLTHKIHLHPFDLYETRTFLNESGFTFSTQQVFELYLAIGGVAKYLTLLSPSLSVTENIQELIFSKNGLLYDEFEDLYSAIFEKYDNHLKIVKHLGVHHYGMTRDEIQKALKIKSGGSLSKWLEDLESSDFITSLASYKKNKKEKIYLLSDEYTRFYLTWFEKNKKLGTDYWLKQKRSSRYSTWAGLSFEVLCVKHISYIKTKLGISGIQTTESFWRNANCQIDLLIEREDNCINLCEITYSQKLDLNKVKEEIKTKASFLLQESKLKKQIINTLITNEEINLTGGQKEEVHKVVVL